MDEKQMPLSLTRAGHLAKTGKYVAGFFVLSILGCIFLIATGGLTAREAALLSILLTVLSILATWLVGHLYASGMLRQAISEVQEFHRTRLRMYALKAAEKVTNLSSELDRLAVYLEQELENTDYESSEDALNSREERLISAVHLISTLKSVNDTALSDWEGVIGDELDEQREDRREREAELKELIERIDNLIAEQAKMPVPTSTEQKEMRNEVKDLARNLAQVTKRISGVRYIEKPHRGKTQKREVETSCPACGKSIHYIQRPSKSSLKPLTCNSCQRRLFSVYRPGSGFAVNLREFREEQILCVDCQAELKVSLDTFPNTSVKVACHFCGASLRAARRIDGISVTSDKVETQPEKRAPVTPQLLETIRRELPPQPWPKGTHRKIAAKLSLDVGLVVECIDELIKSEACLLQVDGRLFIPAPPESYTNVDDRMTNNGETPEQAAALEEGNSQANSEA